MKDTSMIVGVLISLAWAIFSEIELLKSQEEELLSWEALMKDRYLVSLQQEQSGNTERRVQETVQRYRRWRSSAAQRGCPTLTQAHF